MKKSNADADLLKKVVKLGQVIRRHRAEGNLQSVPPPTVWGYMAFIKMARALPHLTLEHIAMATLLGNAGMDDRKMVSVVFNEAFGLQTADQEDPTLGSNLF